MYRFAPLPSRPLILVLCTWTLPGWGCGYSQLSYPVFGPMAFSVCDISLPRSLSILRRKVHVGRHELGSPAVSSLTPAWASPACLSPSGLGRLPWEASCQQQVAGPRFLVPSVFVLERVIYVPLQSLSSVYSLLRAHCFLVVLQFFSVPSFFCLISSLLGHCVSSGFLSLCFLCVLSRFLVRGCCAVP